MEPVDYEIDTAHITGLSLTPLESIKIETSEPYWEAKANLAILTFTFPETRLHEMRFGIMSSINLIVEGGRERDMSDKVLLLERTEYAAAKGCKMSRYDIEKVNSTQEIFFTRIVVTIENVEHDKVLKLAYFGIFRRADVVEAPVRKRKNHTHTVQPQKVAKPLSPRHFSPPADPSYGGLLSDCVVSCLSHSDHVLRLCRALGACYLDHIEENTTHVVLPANLKYDEDALRYTAAKLVSVAWLEKCLDERTRQREEDFELL